MLTSSSELHRESAIPSAQEAVQARPAGRLRRRIFGAVLLFVLPLAAQVPGIQMTGTAAGGQQPRDDESISGIDARMQAKRIAELNKVRQKAMISDAEKLLRLAHELNEDANAGGAGLSPAERMHKAAEIEKLAKQVKDKMTYAVGEPAEISLPFGTSSQR